MSANKWVAHLTQVGEVGQGGLEGAQAGRQLHLSLQAGGGVPVTHHYLCQVAELVRPQDDLTANRRVPSSVDVFKSFRQKGHLQTTTPTLKLKTASQHRHERGTRNKAGTERHRRITRIKAGQKVRRLELTETSAKGSFCRQADDVNDVNEWHVAYDRDPSKESITLGPHCTHLPAGVGAKVPVSIPPPILSCLLLSCSPAEQPTLATAAVIQALPLLQKGAHSWLPFIDSTVVGHGTLSSIFPPGACLGTAHGFIF